MFRRYRHRKLGALQILLIWVMIVLALITLVDLRLRPLIKTVASNQARTYAIKAINNSIASAMLGNVRSYENFVSISYDEDGRVTAVATNTAALNLVAAEITDETAMRIAQLEEQNIKIPIGTLLGHQMLSGRGPRIQFKIIPVGFVESKLLHQLESAGINQTRHQIILEVNSSITAVLPGYSSSAKATVNVTLADTVIVGISPQSFTKVITGGSGEDDLAGLIEDYGAHNQ